MSAAIAKALHDVMTRVGYVQKSGKNTFHNYKYAGEADLLEKLRPAMIEAGLLLIPSIESVSDIDQHGNTLVRVAYTLMHKDGEVWPEKIYAAGCGGDKNKNGVGDKGLYKAITGANKYLLFKLFQIETGDDPENDAADYARAKAQEKQSATRKSSAQAKRDGDWPEFESILADCKTKQQVDWFWTQFTQGPIYGSWKDTWREAATERVEQRRAELPDAPKPDIPNAATETKADYVRYCHEIIDEGQDWPTLLGWWNSDAEKAARIRFSLSKEEVAALKQRMTDRKVALRNTLVETVAAG